MTQSDHNLLDELATALQRGAAAHADRDDEVKRLESRAEALRFEGGAWFSKRALLRAAVRAVSEGAEPPYTQEALDKLLGGA